mgnify:CR=1 FL=1
MDFNIPLFLDSLKIMGLGMLGIFLVTAVIIGAMALLTRFFQDKPEQKGKSSVRRRKMCLRKSRGSGPTGFSADAPERFGLACCGFLPYPPSPPKTDFPKKGAY